MPSSCPAGFKLLWLLDLVRQGRMSSGRAADLLGLSRADMFRLMSDHGLPVHNYDDNELDQELEAARLLGDALP